MVHDKDVVRLAARLLKIPSLTPVSADLIGAAQASLDLLQEYLESAGAICHRLTFEGGHPKWGYAVDNLFAEWPGEEGLGHLCFIGHADVVPPGNAALWTMDPFAGEIRDGFLWGRGATDMKGAVAAFCAAAAGFAFGSAGLRPKVSIIITTDEEWAAVNGTVKVLEWMRDRGFAPTAFLVGEPSSPYRFGTDIKVGRRGSLCGTIEARGIQGHTAYPHLFKNPNRSLSLALALIHSYRWNDDLWEMPATNFETVALMSGDFGQTGIVPSHAKALWNIRFTHAQTVEGLTAKLRNLLEFKPDWASNLDEDADISELVITVNSDTASMPYYSKPSGFTDLVCASVAGVTGSRPAIDAGGGTTDARFVQLFFPEAEIVELGLPENGGLAVEAEGSDHVRGGMHQIDERCSLADLSALTKSYSAILQSFGTSA